MKAAGWSSKNFIIDGFPRNKNNLHGWIKQMGPQISLPYVINIYVSKAVMLKRVAIRAFQSGDSKRNDDNHEVLLKRQRVFEEETLPVIEHFDKEK